MEGNVKLLFAFQNVRERNAKMRAIKAPVKRMNMRLDKSCILSMRTPFDGIDNDFSRENNG